MIMRDLMRGLSGPYCSCCWHVLRCCVSYCCWHMRGSLDPDCSCCWLLNDVLHLIRHPSRLRSWQLLLWLACACSACWESSRPRAIVGNRNASLWVLLGESGQSGCARAACWPLCAVQLDWFWQRPEIIEKPQCFILGTWSGIGE